MAALDDGLSDGANTPARWSCAGAEDLALRSWDAETVAYDATTGATHLLSPPAGAVLRCLATAPDPLTAARIAEQAAGAGFALDADDVTDILDGLASAGLVRSTID